MKNLELLKECLNILKDKIPCQSPYCLGLELSWRTCNRCQMIIKLNKHLGIETKIVATRYKKPKLQKGETKTTKQDS